MFTMHPSSCFQDIEKQQEELLSSISDRVNSIKIKYPFPRRYSSFNTQLNPYFYYTFPENIHEAAAYSSNTLDQNSGCYYVYGDIKQPEMVEVQLQENTYIVLYLYKGSTVSLYEFSFGEHETHATKAEVRRNDQENKPIEIFSRLGVSPYQHLGYEDFAWEGRHCVYTRYLNCCESNSAITIGSPNSFVISVGEDVNEVLSVVNQKGGQIFPPQAALSALKEMLHSSFDVVYNEAVRLIKDADLDQEVIAVVFELTDQNFLDWCIGLGTQEDKDDLKECGPLGWLGIMEWQHNYEAENLSDINDRVQELVNACHFEEAEKEVFLFYKRLIDKLLTSEEINKHIFLSPDCYGIAQYACDGSDLSILKLFLTDVQYKKIEAEEQAYWNTHSDPLRE